MLRFFINIIPKIISFIVLFLGALIILSPLFVVLYTSFTPTGRNSFTLDYYQQAWEMGNFILAFFNSALVAIAVTLSQIITSALAGYALARLEFRGKNFILLLIIATLVIPIQLLVIPIFLILRNAHLINTYWALILPSAANGFGIFLMRQYFKTIPIELEQAAELDGANQLQIIWHILLPLAKPAVITLFLFTFIGEWNDLFKPLVFTSNPQLITVQLALASFQEQFTSNWSLLMAAVVIATIPVILLFILGQKQFIEGIGTTGLKN
ncbi:carbohydrate ABC transporter membrane protein 2, CUT1 family [Cyanobacterium stanieri PCC 7202]|uniref:Carbohydrate ABC transporter membrane protein 2, CUT1 family n=1 Tax=Cyanobacterium stanieri (strain ATCC 29140 / PCC 7202) TaxID=292563 RepID=K9YKG6_CYASC|nr:carbohydrate ABC transporter membrane protein 2, CUT1 family [Cyanobacterium stanieri PCC 7202]